VSIAPSVLMVGPAWAPDPAAGWNKAPVSSQGFMLNPLSGGAAAIAISKRCIY
jgi:hypothetical protein